MASFDASINLRVNADEVNRRIRQLERQFKQTDFSVQIRANNLNRTLKSIAQIERAASALKATFRTISSPGRGALGDAFRVAAKNANDFFDSVISGNKNFAKTTAAVNEQGDAFRALAANIATTEARFVDYVQGAEAASNVNFGNQLKQLEALQAFYQEGLSGRGSPNPLGQNFFEELQANLPQTRAGLIAVRNELERVQDLIDSRSLAGLGVAQNLLEINERLLQVDQDRAEVQRTINNQSSAEVGRSLQDLDRRGANPFGISDEQSNSIINERAEQIERSIDKAAKAEVAAAREVAKLEKGLEDELFQLKSRYEDELVNDKIRSIDIVADKELDAQKRTNDAALKDFDQRLNDAVRKREQAARRRQRFRSDLATGVGFPLLFGGGPGSVLGGALGAVADGGRGGFGSQILFSAIGQSIDRLVGNLRKLGDSFSSADGTLKQLIDTGFNINKATQKRIELLIKEGKEVEAFLLALDKAGITASQVTNLRALDTAFDELQDSFATITVTLISELVPAIVVVTNLIKGFVDSLTGPSIQRAAKFRPCSIPSRSNTGRI